MKAPLIQKISHKSDGSYLVADDADGTKELGEEDTETWVGEMNCVQDQECESCFDVKYDITSDRSSVRSNPTTASRTSIGTGAAHSLEVV